MSRIGARVASFAGRHVSSLAIVVILAGFTLRVWNVNFDQGIGSHPDERSTACFYATSIRMPRNWEEFKDPRQSPLNPLWDTAQQTRRSFTYGHFPLYLGVAFGRALHWLSPLAAQVGVPDDAVTLMERAHRDCDAIAVAGRLTIAFLDTITIGLLYLLGRRMFREPSGESSGPGGAVVGLLAATFYAFSAQAIQLSHFFAMDPASTTFTVLAVYGAVGMLQRPTAGNAALAGLGAGLAISSKFSALPVLAAPVVAGLLAILLEQQRAAATGKAPDGVLQFRAGVGILAALIVAGLSFFATSPYAVLDWQSFLQATLIEQGRMVRGVADMPFTRQYRNTIPYVYFAYQQIAWGLWWPLGIVIALGVLASFADLLQTAVRILANWTHMRPVGSRGNASTLAGTPRHERVIRLPEHFQIANVVIWSWVLPYFAVTGAFLAKFNRYMSPVLPFVAVMAATLIWRIWRADAATPASLLARPATQRIGRVLAVLLAAIGVLGGLFWSVAYTSGVYRSEHTWITASRWMYENIPAGSVILWELWDDPLPKAIPGEPGMDMGSRRLRNIDWSPYEEDSAEKYEILKAKLREADYVAYSSKRIYDSVDELPERYPMTTLYYEAMRDGRLGFETALEVASPPRLFGMTFDDRAADESWSLYDHPQVTVLRKVRNLSDAEFDAVLGGSWQGAIPYYTGETHRGFPLLSTFLAWVGAKSGGDPWASLGEPLGGEDSREILPADAMLLESPLADLPAVDNYRWNVFASERPAVAALVWWLTLTILGWAVWPVCFTLFTSLRDRGYFLSRMIGWLVAGWLLWYGASYGIVQNTVRNAWLSVAVLGVAGAAAAIWRGREIRRFLAANWPVLAAGEAGVGAAYCGFLLIRMANPDLWQPWFGGEKFMEFAFLNGILRSPFFPPVDPHFAGGYINYYYFGIYLAAYLVKLTGIYAEVGFNLTIAALFALTVSNAFSVAYAAWAWRGGIHAPTLSWRSGFWAAWIAPLFVTVIGNLDGFAQVVRRLAEVGTSRADGGEALWGALWAPLGAVSALSFGGALANAAAGLSDVLARRAPMPAYDFWAPSRVIPNTINEFPYWSFLFADLHPHLIGIPVAVLFCAVLLALAAQAQGHHGQAQGLPLRLGTAGLVALLSFLLGTLSSVNLWELPTYFALGAIALLVVRYRWDRQDGATVVASASATTRPGLWLTLAAVGAYGVGAYLFYLPFFIHYRNVGASGIGLVPEPDRLGDWLLIWGFLIFVSVTWVVYASSRRPWLCRSWRRQSRTAHCIAAEGAELLCHELHELKFTVESAENSGDNEISGETEDAITYMHPPASAEIPDPERRWAAACHPTGLERAISLAFRQFDRLPRAIALHQRLVQSATAGYLTGLGFVLLALALAVTAVATGYAVLALCLPPLVLAWLLLWRRGADSDPAAILIALLMTASFAILAGTQAVYLRDFLQGGDWRRMNTLFKFFSQVWVLLGIATALALPRMWQGVVSLSSTRTRRAWGIAWASCFWLLLVASLTFTALGTPARLSLRMVGWRPAFGTLNGMDYMRQGEYTWPNNSNRIELAYDWEAIQWLLRNVRGNAIIVESSEADYYRAGSSRVASMTGLSGLRGMHASEQRPGEVVSAREALHRELWDSLDVERTRELLDEIDAELVYVGQLERYLHPSGVQKLADMASMGLLTVLFENELTTVYAVNGSKP